MRKFFGVAALLAALAQSVCAMQEIQFEEQSCQTQEKTTNQAITSIDEIPEYYRSIAKELSEQPSFFDHFTVDWYLKDEPSFFNNFEHNEDSYIWRTCTKLPLQKKDCRVLSLLSCNALQFFPNAWIIHDLGLLGRERNSCSGVMLWLFNTIPMCSLDELTSMFEKITQELQCNWQSSRLAQHPDMFHKKSEDEWHLFVKKSTMKDEFNFMRFLIDKFDMEENADCWNAWIGKTGSCEFRKEDICLWIRKNAFDEFQRIFKLEITK